MPSEPLEAEFACPPALSRAQEDEFRNLEREGPLSRQSTRHSTAVASIADIEDEYKHRGVRVVTFDQGTGEDPREWSKGKKWYITGTTAYLCLAVALGSAIITGDLRGPVEEFNTSQEIVNLTVTCFVMGFGIGPLIFAPLSEVVGRKPMYCISIFLYFIFTLPSALAPNAATLVVSRMIAGLAASAPMCNVGGSIADIWKIEERGIPMAVFSGTLFMGPCVGPLVGGWIGMRAGWRWIYWVLFIFVGVSFILTLFIPETLAPVLLRRKAAKLRTDNQDQNYHTLEELERRPFKETLIIALIRPLVMLFREPIVLFMAFYLSFVYSLLYLLFFAFPIAFEEIRGFSPGITGVTFISIMLGIAFALSLMPYQERIYRKVTADGTFPEARLYPMMLGSILLPVALFIFAFTGAYVHVHWIGPCVAGTIFGFAMIFIYVAANSYIVDSYSNYAASAIAAKTLLRSEVGAMVPLFVTQMFHGMGFQYAGLLLALIACLILPIPFVFYKYGGGIRSRSTRATTALRGQGVKGEKGDLGH
ncbi:MFS polyamine transporter [Collybia nuda]|uniref:MFS polyamine transporter n=1 Tax=Collybia nuda TaxID=64659 RepID=A0A9P5Y570_9AGAR|nr:MFS polyamine transporter [Collybia nuda]